MSKRRYFRSYAPVVGAVLFLLPLASPVSASTNDLLATGLKPNQAYALGEVDAVNAFNGNLNVRVPFGPTYRTTGTLRYQFGLHWNTNFWQLIEYSAINTAGTRFYFDDVNQYSSLSYEFTTHTPAGDSAGGEAYPRGEAGVGWHLNFGRLERNETESSFITVATYIDESGASHGFGLGLHGSAGPLGPTYYSFDGSYIRLRAVSAPAGSLAYEVDLPDGIRKRFSCTAHCGDLKKEEWELDWIADPYGNALYFQRIAGPGGVAEWTLYEGSVGEDRYFDGSAGDVAAVTGTNVVRIHKLEFAKVLGWQTRLQKALLASTAGNHSAEYLFDYEGDELGEGTGTPILRTPILPFVGSGTRVPYRTSASSDPDELYRTTQVSLLQSITLPEEGGTWSFTYHKGTTPEELAMADMYIRYNAPSLPKGHHPAHRLGGQLQSLTVPTGGTFRYTYANRSYPRRLCGTDNQPAPAPQLLGVASKTQLDQEGSVVGVWHYSGSWYRRTGVEPCDGPPSEFVGAVLEPDGALTLSYFDIGLNSPTFGAPFAPETFVHDSSSKCINYRNPAGTPADPDPCPAGTAKPEHRQFLSSDTYQVNYGDFAGDLVNAVRRMLDHYRRAGETGLAKTKLRSHFVRYEWSEAACNQDDLLDDCRQTNLRLAREHTRYDDDLRPDHHPMKDVPAVIEKVHGDFDGLGNYRSVETTSNFRQLSGGDPERRIEYTFYNKGVNYTPPSTVENGPADTANWILGKYSHQTVWEAGEASGAPAQPRVMHSRFAFDERGFLYAKRSMWEFTYAGDVPAGSDPAKVHRNITVDPGHDDFLSVFTRWNEGAGSSRQVVVEEKSYGGDGGNLGTSWLDESGQPVLDARARLDYTIRTTSQYGTTKKTEYFNCGQHFLTTYSAGIDRHTGSVLWSDDVSGARTSFSYDKLGRFVTATPPGGEQSQKYAYSVYTHRDVNQLTVERVNAQGQTIAAAAKLEYEYDHLGRPSLETVYRADGVVGKKRTSYTPAGQVRRETTVSSNPGSTSPAVTYTYDALKRVVSVTSPGDHATGSSTVTTTHFGGRGSNVRSTKLALENGDDGAAIHSYNRDAFGRLREADDTITHATYGYDPAGNLLKAELHKHGAGGTTRKQERHFKYDGRGVLFEEIHPELGGTDGYGVRHTVDARAHVTSSSHVRGTTADPEFQLHYAYDAAERLRRVGGGDTARPLKVLSYYPNDCTEAGCAPNLLRSSVRHNYIPHPLDRHNEQIDVTVTHKATYHPLTHRQAGVTVTASSPQSAAPYALSVNGTVSYGYDDVGQLQTVGYPAFQDGPARTIRLDYSNGHLKTVKQDQTTLASVTYHPNGLENVVAFRTGVRDTVTNGDNDLARPKQITWTYINGSLHAGPYAYDGIGNIKRIDSPAGRDSYWYDTAARLTGAVVGGRQQTFSYDEFSTLGAVTTGGQTLTLGTAWKNNRVISIKHGAQAERGGFIYDNAGNLRVMPDPRPGAAVEDKSRFTYDALNMMTSAAGRKFGRIFIYGPDDERVGVLEYRPVPDEVRESWSFRDGSRVMRDFGRAWSRNPQTNTWTVSGWSWRKDYVYRGMKLNTTFAPAPEGRRDVHLDHLGTIRLLTDANGVKVDGERKYYPFGQPLVQLPLAERHAFTGHERDLADPATFEADLDYMHARYYAPVLGRFFSVDPTWESADLDKPQSWNRYTYVENNPVNRTDPDGRIGLSVIGKAIKLVIKGGDIAMTVQGIVADVNTLRSATATGGQKLFAAASLASEILSPVSIKDANALKAVASRLPDDAVVVRGGRNTPESFVAGPGVTLDANGNLQGVSVNSAPGATVEQLSQGLPHTQVGVTTVGQVRAAGGAVVPSPMPDNCNHCTMGGITPEKASELMTPTRRNPTKPKAKEQ